MYGSATKIDLNDIVCQRYVSVSGVGWYRFGTFNIGTYTGTVDNFTFAPLIRFIRNYSSNVNELHTFYMSQVKNKRKVIPVLDLSGTNIITKFRSYDVKISKNGSTNNYECFEFFYNSSNGNYVTIYIDDNMSVTPTSKISPIDLVMVPDNPGLEGENVVSGTLVEHTFSANAVLGSQDIWPLT